MAYLVRNSSSFTICWRHIVRPTSCGVFRVFINSNAMHRAKRTIHDSPNESKSTLSSGDIRRIFVQYFTDKHDHLFLPASSTIPANDKTLLFTNAGMNQFKSIFQGTVHPQSPLAKYKRVVNSQKCVRAGGKHNDLDDVGKDVYHHTFFEMLGNWSFGDYFKEETCCMAWDLLTTVYQLQPDRLYVTYFGGDDKVGLPADTECRDIWRNIGLPDNRIIPYGMSDNFWEMGQTGPCGMCSEIHYDRIGDRNASSLVNMDDPDVLEIWNLVFPQFNREADGSLQPLPTHNVDTGMGLERLVSIIQGVKSNYDTDLFQPIIQAIHKGTNAPSYQGRVGTEDISRTDMAYRVVADHIRTLTVTIMDGGRPGYYKQGYIIKRLIRRAVRYATETLQASPGFIASLVPIVVETLGEAYPELNNNPQEVMDVINREEQQFLKVLQEGRKFLDKKIMKLKEPVLPGEVAWKMYDGFGFPIDLTVLMAEEKGIVVDMDSYEEAREKTREATSQGGVKNQSLELLDASAIAYLKDNDVPLTDDSYKYGYDHDENGNYEFDSIGANIKALRVGRDFVESVDASQSCDVILDKTCFYAEQGGQQWDEGYFTKARDKNQETAFQVDNVQVHGGYVVHSGTSKLPLSVGERMKLFIDEERRLALMRNHTATHILNWSLRGLLGDGVEQRGSLVAADKLRFDFSYDEPLSMSKVEEIQDKVNEVVEQYTPISSQDVPLEDAMEIEGIRAVFGEAYPDPVNVVSIGIPVSGLISNPFGPGGFMSPVELCGGTHLLMSEHVGKFVITDEGAVSGGTRRITAITGQRGWEADDIADSLQRQVDELKLLIDQNLQTEGSILSELFTEANDLLEEVSHALIPVWREKEMMDELMKMKEKIKDSDKKKKKMAAKEAIRKALEVADKCKGQTIVVEEIQGGTNMKTLQQMLHQFKDISQGSAIMLYSIDKEDNTIICMCCTTEEAIEKGLNATEWISHVNSVINGKAGGKDSFARLQGKVDSRETIVNMRDIAEDFARSKL
ncbi:alanine--tRNA ligase, cytoplasmic-like [Ptychodera flava]|uniref:alanine--tRNA ligase, cytoplasmic-like n=1 Tax=Ptychodera flava TaxID=63121 RepID=UPI00396A26CE